MDVIEALHERRSTRVFTDEAVPREVVEKILRAAGRAPSGTNTQPWKVYVVVGAARDALCGRVLAKRAEEPWREGRDQPFGEYLYYPIPIGEPYLGRQRMVGWELYSRMGVQRGDRAASHAAAGRNYRFFDAPVGMIFTLDRALEKGSWIDLGIFLQSIMLAALSLGYDTCPQGAWAQYHDVVRDTLAIPAAEVVVCGMSLGVGSRDAPANAWRSEREAVESFAVFVEQVPNG